MGLAYPKAFALGAAIPHPAARINANAAGWEGTRMATVSSPAVTMSGTTGRLGTTKVSGPGRIADDVLQAACIDGTGVKDWQEVVFAGLEGRSEFEGKEIGAGPGTNVMGSALISLAWLANKLAEFGLALESGMQVMSGSFTRQYLLNPGDRIEASFTPVGQVRAEFP